MIDQDRAQSNHEATRHTQHSADCDNDEMIHHRAERGHTNMFSRTYSCTCSIARKFGAFHQFFHPHTHTHTQSAHTNTQTQTQTQIDTLTMSWQVHDTWACEEARPTETSQHGCVVSQTTSRQSVPQHGTRRTDECDRRANSAIVVESVY